MPRALKDFWTVVLGAKALPTMDIDKLESPEYFLRMPAQIGNCFYFPPAEDEQFREEKAVIIKEISLLQEANQEGTAGGPLADVDEEAPLEAEPAPEEAS